MKSFYLLIIAAFTCLSSFAADNYLVVNNGDWTSNNSWSLGHKPANGETVIVPAGMTVIVSSNVMLSPDNIILKVYGTIHFAVGKLQLGSGSLVEIAAGAKITTQQGNPSDRITIGGIIQYSGSDGTVTGPVVYSLTENATLPVKFISYSVSRTSNGVSVEWATSEEMNADLYVVERSEDGSTWNAIGIVTAVGNSSLVNNYSFTDKKTVSKVAFYRVKQVDIDGRFVYTSIKSVRVEAIASTDVRVANNANNLVIEFAKGLKGNVVVRIVSLSGQVMAQQSYNNPAGNIVLNKGAFKGNYVISLSNGQDVNLAKQVML